MGSFKRGLLGYRRAEVDAAIAARDTRIGELERELSCISGMIVERDRELRDLRTELREATERHERSIASLESISLRVEEIQAQARGQATRIRMKALREAVEVSRRVQDLAGRIGAEAGNGAVAPGAGTQNGDPAAPAATAENGDPAAEASPKGPQPVSLAPRRLFSGAVEVEIGPLADFSQLVSLEDAAGQIGATSEISVERFSEGRATLAIRLEEPTDLVGELDRRSALGFTVRQVEGERIVLDVAVAEQRAA